MRLLVKLILTIEAMRNCIGLFVIVKRRYEQNLLRHPRTVIFVYIAELIAETYAAIYL